MRRRQRRLPSGLFCVTIRARLCLTRATPEVGSRGERRRPPLPARGEGRRPGPWEGGTAAVAHRPSLVSGGLRAAAGVATLSLDRRCQACVRPVRRQTAVLAFLHATSV